MLLSWLASDLTSSTFDLTSSTSDLASAMDGGGALEATSAVGDEADEKELFGVSLVSFLSSTAALEVEDDLGRKLLKADPVEGFVGYGENRFEVVVADCIIRSEAAAATAAIADCCCAAYACCAARSGLVCAAAAKASCALSRGFAAAAASCW
jgi:hypothetical protein